MGINEKFPPQLLPLSVNPASGRARASLLRSMCPISGFPTASPQCRSHMRPAPLQPPGASSGRPSAPIPSGTAAPNTAIGPSPANLSITPPGRSITARRTHHVDEQHVTCLKSAHPSGPANAHLHASQ